MLIDEQDGDIRPPFGEFFKRGFNDGCLRLCAKATRGMISAIPYSKLQD